MTLLIYSKSLETLNLRKNSYEEKKLMYHIS